MKANWSKVCKEIKSKLEKLRNGRFYGYESNKNKSDGFLEIHIDNLEKDLKELNHNIQFNKESDMDYLKISNEEK